MERYRPGRFVTAGRLLLAAALCIAAACGCGRPKPTVVIYCAVDDVYARPILARFEQRTGIKVRALYDAEAAKSAGLVAKLLAEKSRPQADAYWNSETSRMLVLQAGGVLQPYSSPAAADLPPRYRDPERYWIGMTPRARVIVYNTRLVRAAEAPRTLADLAKPRWRGKVGVCDPHIGTASSWIVALALARGDDWMVRWLSGLKANGLRVLPGNSVVADQVARGELLVGVTDTDDVWTRKLDGQPVEMIYPDQQSDGTLVIPCAAGLIEGAPHGAEGKRLIDYLVSPEVEADMARSSARHWPIRPSTAAAPGVPALSGIRSLPADWRQVAANLTRVEGLVDRALSPR